MSCYLLKSPLLDPNFIAWKISSPKSFILKLQLCSGWAVYVCALDVTAGWSARMKSLFVQFGLTGSDYPDPNVTLLRVRFLSSWGRDQFDFGALTFGPRCPRRSSRLCRWGRCFAGRWWNRAEPNWTGRFNCERRVGENPEWDDVCVDSNPFTGESRAGVGKRWVWTGPLKTSVLSVLIVFYKNCRWTRPKLSGYCFLEETLVLWVFLNDSLCNFVAFYAVFPVFFFPANDQNENVGH